MARRSSARLRNQRTSMTPGPKRVSLSHDTPTATAAAARTPRTVPAKLSALDEENDDMPGAFPHSPDHDGTPTAKRQRQMQETPQGQRPLRPSDEEMHPERHHQTTAKPLEEARHLGFSNMPQTEPAANKNKSKIATWQATPSRTQNQPQKQRDPVEDVKSPTFQFTFRREHSLELSPDAKRLMMEKREEAQRIREQMVSSGEASQHTTTEDVMAGRKLAKPKGRFSEVHGKAFERMESIAGHASSFRMNKGKEREKEVEVETPQQRKAGVSVVEAAQESLKRSPSKAQLDEPETGKGKGVLKSAMKPQSTGTGLPKSKSASNLGPSAPESPSKRQKRTEGDNVSSARPSSRDAADAGPSTPQQSSKKSLPAGVSYPNLAALTTPTQSSLARAASVKSQKTGSLIPGPTLNRSPSKPNVHGVEKAQQKGEAKQVNGQATPLLHRSPSKAASLFGQQSQHSQQTQGAAPEQGSPLLQRPASHGSPGKKAAGEHNSRDSESEGTQKPNAAPLLARTPHKMSVSKPDVPATTTEGAETPGKSKSAGSSIPLLSRSPAKLPQQAQPSENDTEKPLPQTPGKSGGGLMSRFNLLRRTPMKSILRSPQRLYSNDPAKIAAGTHLATPPKNGQQQFGAGQGSGQQGFEQEHGGHGMSMTTREGVGRDETPMSAARKRVDFTASTKARWEEGGKKVEVPSSSSSGGSKASPGDEVTMKETQTPGAAYPDLSAPATATAGESEVEMEVDEAPEPPSPSPQKRRQTITPSDFTFRAGSHDIVFGQPKFASGMPNGRPSTIRAVSAEPAPISTTAPTSAGASEGKTIPGSRKRKLAFENDHPSAVPRSTTDARTFDADRKEGKGKENSPGRREDDEQEDGHRPAKRTKMSAATTPVRPSGFGVGGKPRTAPPGQEKTGRRTTLGVKPRPSKAGSSHAGVGRNGAGASGGAGAGAGGAAGNAGGKIAGGKGGATISRERLNALAMPKNRRG